MPLRDSLRKGLHLLGTILVGRGSASEEQVQQALDEQRRRKWRGWSHRRVGQLLIDMSAVTRHDVDSALEEQAQVRREQDEPVAGEPGPAPQPPNGSQLGATAEPGAPFDVRFVASQRGTVYHAETCPSGRKTSTANARYFSSREQAERAGLRPCAKCR